MQESPQKMNNQPTASPVVEVSPEQPSLLLVKTQKEAVAYIQDQGYQVKKSKFSDDVKAGLVAKSEHGFDKAALMAYALAHCKAKKQIQNAAVAEAQAKRLQAEADDKSNRAELSRMKLMKEQGRLMERDLHERELAARANFFARQHKTSARALAGPIINLVRGDASQRLALIHYLEDFWTDALDAFANTRSFVMDEDDENNQTHMEN